MRWSDRTANEQLIASLWRSGHIRSERVAAAFAAVPRHVFLPHLEPQAAYRDEAHVTKWDGKGRPVSSSSQPAIMAVMLEQLGVLPGQRVLEIGAGTGYNAALLSHLVGDSGSVVTVDIDEEVALDARSRLSEAGQASVVVECADGSFGWPAGAPFDRIVLTACACDLVPAWIDQLKADGRLVVPLSLRGVERSIAFQRSRDRLVSTSIRPCGFVPMRGAAATRLASVELGEDTRVFLEPTDECPVDGACLHAMLHEPGELVVTGVRVSRKDLLDGVALWLGLYAAPLARLVAYADAPGRTLVPELLSVPPIVATLALTGSTGLAALTRLDEGDQDVFELAVRPFGRDGAGHAVKLARSIGAWEAAGRPASSDLQIDAYVSGSSGQPTAVTTTVDLEHALLAIHWPGAPPHECCRGPESRVADFNA